MADLEPQAPASAADEPAEDDEDDFEDLEPDLKGLVEYVARALVDKPEAVKVDEVPDGNTTVYELEVDEEDIGKVIGRQGRVVRGLRALVKAAATRKGTRVDLDVV
ncbi:MAG: KH domain-containing protein [Chloroflexota bacterium]